MAKEKSTNSGQSTGELYSSNWMHYEKLAFQVPFIGASKSRDILIRINLREDENKKEVVDTPLVKRKTLAEKKLELLPKCTETITTNANTKAPPPNKSGTTKMPAFSKRKSCHSWINASEE